MFKVSLPPSLLKDFAQTTIPQPISQNVLHPLKSQITIPGGVVKVNGEESLGKVEIKPREGLTFPCGLLLNLKFLQPTLAILFQLRREKKQILMFVKFTVQRHRLTESWRPNHKITEPFPSPAQHLTTTLLKAIPFTSYLVSYYEKKITRHTKRHKNTIRSDSENIRTRLWRMLESSGQQFKTNI